MSEPAPRVSEPAPRVSEPTLLKKLEATISMPNLFSFSFSFVMMQKIKSFRDAGCGHHLHYCSLLTFHTAIDGKYRPFNK